MTYMPLRTVTIDLGNLRGQIFSRTGFAPSAVQGQAYVCSHSMSVVSGADCLLRRSTVRGGILQQV